MRNAWGVEHGHSVVGPRRAKPEREISIPGGKGPLARRSSCRQEEVLAVMPAIPVIEA